MTKANNGVDPFHKIMIWTVGMLTGMILGAIITLLAGKSPNDVCEIDCQARGFEGGKFVTFDPEHCSCWNNGRVFEKRQKTP